MHSRLGPWVIQKALCGFAMSRHLISNISHHQGKQRRAFWEPKLSACLYSRDNYVVFFMTASICKPVLTSPQSLALTDGSAGLWAGIREFRGQVSQPFRLHTTSVAWPRPRELRARKKNHHTHPEPQIICFAPFF